jgi:hypothetical protein
MLRSEKARLKLAKEELAKRNSRTGDITPYLLFKELLQNRATSLLRMHPPDILHTVIHGSMEYCLGFTLQIVKLISSIDKVNFGSSPKLLEECIDQSISFF